jgi:hypothetical protein
MLGRFRKLRTESALRFKGLGGTGRYIGARGQLTSTRNAEETVYAGVHAAKVMRASVPDWRELLL